MRIIRIGEKSIGEDYPAFIIAEAGVNHNGRFSLAQELIDKAKASGADAVKFQAFRAQHVATITAEKAKYQKTSGSSGESQYEMLRNLEISEDELRELAGYAEKKGIIFLASPFGKENVDFLNDIDIPALKVASGEITNFPMLRYIAQGRKPLILSTGMATLSEIDEALRVIESARSNLEDIILLHCVSSYPARVHDLNLKAIETLRQAFKLPVGFSDHSLSTSIPVAAVALGAVIVEKHLTADRGLDGPDHKASLEPHEFKMMVGAIRDAEKAFGNGLKKPTTDEEEMKMIARRSIVAKIAIPKGVVITADMLDVRRPGFGISAKYFDKILGKRTKKSVKKDSTMNWELIY